MLVTSPLGVGLLADGPLLQGAVWERLALVGEGLGFLGGADRETIAANGSTVASEERGDAVLGTSSSSRAVGRTDAEETRGTEISGGSANRLE